VQYFHADERHYRMEAVFFIAHLWVMLQVAVSTTCTGSTPAEFFRAFFHECYAWAARLGLTRAYWACSSAPAVGMSVAWHHFPVCWDVVI